MKFILGKKVAMTQLWQGDKVIPVTQVVAGPCTVLQIKNMEQDGYRAVQVGSGSRRASLITKALQGHFKGFGDFRYTREFRLDEKENIGDLKVGDQVSLATFAVGDNLTIVGISKGKGFQGVVKRHGFHGQDASHGNKDQLRASGSVGAGGVQHVFKGIRMAGRMGGDRVTLHDAEIIQIDEATNSLFIKGAVPGARNGLIMIFGEGELKLGMPEIKVEEPIIEEAPVVEEKIEEVVEIPVAEEIKTELKEEAPVVEENKVEETAVEEKTEEIKEEIKA
jgi:large subunit ribosomal protein L3